MPLPTKAKPDPIPFNPAALEWARRWRSRSYEEAASSINVTPETIENWEAGKGRPTLKQARRLAEVYGRHFLEFFGERPDAEHTKLVPDFRMHAGEERPQDDRVLTEIQEWGEAVRRNAIDLYDMLGEDVPVFPERLTATTSSDVEKSAIAAREAVGFPLERQLSLRVADKRKLPQMLRQRIEALGVIVLRNSELAKSRARGLCVYLSPLPIVMFSSEAPSAQAFTIAHELAHVVLKQSAISGIVPDRDATSEVAKVERWCNKFAAAFLIPRAVLVQMATPPSRPQESFPEAMTRELAGRFAVSPHAMLLRLVDLGYVKADFYWSVMRRKFLDEEAAYKAGPMKTKYYGSRYRSSVGDLYTGLVLEAWATGRITNHSAAEFMGIKSLTHLEAIRDNFGS